jgi:hypothetical protein
LHQQSATEEALMDALGYLNMAIQGDLGTNYASAVKVVA